MNDISGSAILLLMFFSVISIAETLTRTNVLNKEIARKTVHLAGGLGCLLFPFLISSWITVAVLALLFGTVFYVGEKLNLLKSLSSVERTSIGSLLFPISILILFILSHGQIWVYVSALLVLVLADTAAALTGVHFGKTFYETGPGEKKSLEGTLAFCVIGFMAVFIPLTTLSEIPMTTCLLTALLMSFLLAGLEAVSIRGTDNLYVPLGTVYLLLKVPAKPELEILFQCLSLLGLSIILHIENRRHKTLQVRPLIILMLIIFSAWSLGSAEWMIPVMVGFIIYNRFCLKCAPLPNLSAREILRPLYPSIGILFLANMTLEFYFWFAPFLVATSLSSSLCMVNRFRKEPQPSRLSALRLIPISIMPLILSLLCCFPFQTVGIFQASLWATPICTAFILIFNRVVPLSLTPFTWSYAIPITSTFAALLHAVLQKSEVVTLIEPSTWAEVFR